MRCGSNGFVRQSRRQFLTLPAVASQPVGYRTPAESPDFTSLPQFPLELDLLQLSRLDMADYARQARDLGVNYIGACCGAVA